MTVWSRFFRARSTGKRQALVKPGDHGNPAQAQSDLSLGMADLEAEVAELEADVNAVEAHVQKTPTTWTPTATGGLMTEKHVPAPDLGGFGVVSLTAEITVVDEGKHKCSIRAVCLPLMVEQSRIFESLSEAKGKATELMAASALSLMQIARERTRMDIGSRR